MEGVRRGPFSPKGNGPFYWQQGGNISAEISAKSIKFIGLKIRVSVVRFRPWAPNPKITINTVGYGTPLSSSPFRHSTSIATPHTSAFGSKADIPNEPADVR
jgi:hypothetical protein